MNRVTRHFLGDPALHNAKMRQSLHFPVDQRRIEPDRNIATVNTDHLGRKRRDARINRQRQHVARGNSRRQIDLRIGQHRHEHRYRHPAQIGSGGDNPRLQVGLNEMVGQA